MFAAIDTQLFYFFNNSIKNSALDYFMPMFIKYSDWYLIFIVSLIILIYQNKKKGLSFILVAIIAIAITDGIAYRIIKPFFGRIRPCNVLEKGSFNLMAGCSSSFSFPSQHAANMFALAGVVSRFYKKATPYAIFVASMVALSRVYVGVHYPFDVTAGAIIGYLLGTSLARLFLNKNNVL